MAFCVQKRKQTDRKLYLNSIEQPPTVTRLCIVANLLFLPNYNWMPSIVTGCCQNLVAFL